MKTGYQLMKRPCAVLTWLAVCTGTLPVLAQRQQPEQLVPANFSQVSDVLGHRWDVQTNGTINDGYNNCFDGAMYLRVNGTDFRSSARQMRASVREFVLSNSIANVRVTRRILIDTQRGAARYLDVFENTHSSSVSLNVQLRTMLGNTCQQVVNSAGQPFAGALGKGDVGLGAIHSSSYRPGVFFLVADPRSKHKPTVSVQSRRTFLMTYTLKLKPRQTVSLLHVVAQRRKLTPAGVVAVAKQFYDRKPINMQIPKPLSRTVYNFQYGLVDFFDGEPLLQPVMDLSDYFDAERGEDDFLVLGEEARFQGQLQGAQFNVETQFGRTEVPLEQVAMLIGGNGVGRRMQLFLRNGEVILGDVATSESFVFEGQRGLDVPLRPESIDLLITQADKETDGKAEEDVAAVITTQDGQRLAARKPESTKLELATPWGPLTVSLNEIQRLWIEEDPVPTFRILLSNLSNVPIVPTGADLVVDTRRWGEVRLKFAEVSSIVNLELKKDSDDNQPTEMPVPYCLLAGETRLAATIDLDSLPLVTATGVSRVDLSTVRQLFQSETEEPSNFVAILDNGEEMTGTIPLRLLPVRMGGHTWRVPLKHFLEVQLKRESESDEVGRNSKPPGANSAIGGTETAAEPTQPATAPSAIPQIQPPAVTVPSR